MLLEGERVKHLCREVARLRVGINQREALDANIGQAVGRLLCFAVCDELVDGTEDRLSADSADQGRRLRSGLARVDSLDVTQKGRETDCQSPAVIARKKYCRAAGRMSISDIPKTDHPTAFPQASDPED